MLLCIEYISPSMIPTSWYISLQNQAREPELWVLSSLAQNANDSETFYCRRKTKRIYDIKEKCEKRWIVVSMA